MQLPDCRVQKASCLKSMGHFYVTVTQLVKDPSAILNTEKIILLTKKRTAKEFYMIFKGKIVKILTQKDDDWGRYRVEDASGALKLAVGVIPGAVLDMYVELDGEDKTTNGANSSR